MSSLALLSGEVLGSRSNPGIPDPLPASMVSASHVLAPAMAVHTSYSDLVPMPIQSELGTLQRLEETICKAMGEVITRLDESNRRCDQAARRLGESNRRRNHADRWLDESNRRRDQLDRRCDPTLKELRTDFVALNVQKSASPMLPQNLQKGEKSMLECITHFPELKHANSSHYFSNPMEELRSLKQTGMVSDYYNRFKMLLEKVDYIEEHYVVSLFVSGLKDPIQKLVRLFTPKSLAHALSSARLQESCVNFRGNYYANFEVREEVSIEETEKGTRMMNSTQTVEVMEGVWMEETENEMVIISKESEFTTGCGYESVEVFEEKVWIEEAELETAVMKLQESSIQSESQPAGNLGELHTAVRSQSPSKEIGKRIQSVKQELISHELAYKITIGLNENRCEEKEISETEQREEDASAVVVKQHFALTKNIALAEVEMLSEETEKKEFPLEGSYELTSSTHESKREQNFGALTNAKSMSQKLDHHQYLMSFLTRMEGDGGVCTYASHTSHSIRKDCSMDLNLLGSLPWAESYSFFLPAHHKGNLSAFAHMVWVLLTGKSPYSHNLVIIEEPSHRTERILLVSKEHYYRTEWFLLHSMRMFGGDIKYICIASGAILIEAGRCKVISHYGDKHPGW